MTDIDDWEARFSQQTTLLSTHIELLASVPPKRRRRWRLLEWVCVPCGDSVVEVLDTEPYRTLLASGTSSPTEIGEAPDPHASLEEYVRWRLRQPQSIRRGEQWWTPLAAGPASDSSRAVIMATCRCRQRTLNEQMVFDDLVTGRKKRLLH